MSGAAVFIVKTHKMLCHLMRSINAQSCQKNIAMYEQMPSDLDLNYPYHGSYVCKIPSDM